MHKGVTVLSHSVTQQITDLEDGSLPKIETAVLNYLSPFDVLVTPFCYDILMFMLLFPIYLSSLFISKM